MKAVGAFTRRYPALLLDLALGLAVVVLAVGVAGLQRGAGLELGEAHLLRLDGETRELLDGLDDRVFFTYYVSPVERMPSHMRRLERDVTDFLAALADAAGGRVDYQIVDPTADPDLEVFAGKRKVAPVRTRHVARDAWSEQEVWSTLTIAYGPRAPAMIHGLSPEHVPRLQQLVVQHLRAMIDPPKPVVALAAPPGFTLLGLQLADRAELIEVDLSGDAPLPEAADVLFWIEPRDVSPARLRELRRYLDAGKSVVVAGTPLDIELLQAPDVEPQLEVARTGFDAAGFWDTFGLRPVDGLVLDGRNAPLTIAGESYNAPFRITCIATNHDFHTMAFEPNGTFVFLAPTPLAVDGERLAEGGWSATVLATTSEQTWIQGLPDAPLPLSQLDPANGLDAAKQPLIVQLTQAEPWKGQLIAMAGSTPFRDELLTAQGVAHPRLLKTLVDTLTDEDRLVMGRADLRTAAPLPELPAGERLRWRLVCILAAPLLMALLGVVRDVRAAAARLAASLRGALRAGRFMLPAVVGLGLLGWIAANTPGRMDLTAEGLNSVHPTTARLASEAGADGPLRVELLFSPPERLPPDLRPWPGRVADLFDELSRAGVDVALTRTWPEQLDDDGRGELAEQGIVPARVTSTDEEVTTVRSVYLALRLSSGERTETLRFRDAAAFENLEFRVAFALHRLVSGERPHVVVASDAPRLSAAEAHQFYQTQGLIAPQGKDVYSISRQLLEDVDFRVTHVNPQLPDMPDDVDAIVWLQPRRPATAMLGEVADALYHGGNVLIAAQHFNIQSRQYRGTQFEFVYWPQPQSPDLELYWLPEFGVELVREPLFDEVSTRVSLESQVNRSMRREFEVMESVLPFNIRAVSSTFAPDSPITRGLGDQAMLWAAYMRWDEARLAAAGLRATPLISTSDKAWHFLWKGGWIPPEILAGPGAVDADERVDAGPSGTASDVPPPEYDGPLPLAVLFEGTFPWPRQAFVRAPISVGPDGQPLPAEPLPEYPIPEPVGEQDAGRLLLIGCSEPFKDARLTDPLLADFRGDQLLLNAVTALALPEDLAAVASRRPVARGFGVVDDDVREAWRLRVVLFGPAALLVFAALRRLLRGRRPVIRVGAAA